MTKEGDTYHQHDVKEQLPAFQLPADLAEFLRREEYACVTAASDQGTVHVIKAHRADIAGMGDRVPMRVSHAVYEHPLAPVIRTVVKLYDQPERPLALETFINVSEADQRTDFAALGDQAALHLLFYDEDLTYQKGITLPNTQRAAIATILQRADTVRAGISAERYDFDAAKAAVMARTTL
jgi:hypothetical protein